MKKNLFIIGATALMLLMAATLRAQTAGTLTFTFSTTSTGGYSPKHLMAIWIENSSPAFVKTKLKRASNDNLDHLNIWTSKSGSNVVDATTGATISSHGTVTVNWNGTGVNGSPVPDGTYSLWVEMAWASSMTTGKTVQSFSFTKGPAAVHLTPSNTVNFSNITLDWTPSASAVNDIPETNGIRVFPNPTDGPVNIAFDQFTKPVRIRILNSLGMVMTDELMQPDGSGMKSIDLGAYSTGIYFIQVGDRADQRIFRVLRN